MRKITLLMAVIATTFVSNIKAGVDPTTAWWKAETFESNTAGTNLKTGWTDNGGSPYVMSQTLAAQTNGSATGIVLGFPIASANAFAESSAQTGARGVYKTFTNALTGYVYGKTSFYQSTSGTTYALKNTAGTTVFEFGGNGGSSGNTLWSTGVANTSLTLGTRAKWADIEFVLDIPNLKIVSLLFTFAGTTKSYSNITLPAGTDVKSLYVTMTRSYCAAGLDNTTIGQLAADTIKSLTGATSLQTLASGNVTTDFNVTSFSNVMNTDFIIAKTDLDVKWSISNWGSLVPADTLLIKLERNSSDFRIATLTAGSISASDSITLKATFGKSILTKKVLVKALSIDGMKSSLSSEIATSNALIAAVTDVNPYITNAKSALQTKITAAQAVVDNSSATIAEATIALTNIQAAEPVFTTAMTPYNSYIAYIGTVQAAYDAEVRTAQFFVTVKGTLNTALSNSATARTTITSTDDITAAKTALQTAYTQFTTDVPAYANLQTQIATVTSRLAIVTPRKGDSQFLMFPTATVDALTTAKTTAEGVLANGTTATQLATAQTDLATALTTFNAAKRVAPSSTLSYKIYTYGVDNGDGGTAKMIVYADSSDSLKYAAVDFTGVANAEWTITETATGVYNIVNKNTGKYFNGQTVSATSMDITLPEGTTQSNLIQASNDTYLLYYIVNPSGKALEVDAWYTSVTYGKFVISSTPANRFRFCYQFEPVSPSTSIVSSEQSAIKVYVAKNNAIIDGIKVGETYTVYNALGTIISKSVANSTKLEVVLPSNGLYLVTVGNKTYKLIK